MYSVGITIASSTLTPMAFNIFNAPTPYVIITTPSPFNRASASAANAAPSSPAVHINSISGCFSNLSNRPRTKSPGTPICVN